LELHFCIKPAFAIAALAGVVALLLFLVLASNTTRAERNLPFDKPPEVLAERARDIIANLGYQNSPVDEAHGFFFDQNFPRYLATQDFKGWEVMRTGQPLTLYYWYKQAPRYLVADGSVVILPWNPASDVAGMTNVSLDPRGVEYRLRVTRELQGNSANLAHRVFDLRGRDDYQAAAHRNCLGRAV